ncbi:hypothetical protein VWZ82_01410 [Phaeobacter sp. JH20_41]|uniref:hypothetical protein n=1 Tax=Phaeobacter sp. JH20_41 TaxID=3112498 RepID=UPI003A83FC07
MSGNDVLEPQDWTVEEPDGGQPTIYEEPTARSYEEYIKGQSTKIIVDLFIKANVTLVVVLAVIFISDLYFLHGPEPKPERVIDKEVIMTLIGATAVQLGAAIIVIFRGMYQSSGKSAP